MKTFILIPLLSFTLSFGALAGITCENNLDSFSITSNDKEMTLTVKNKNTNLVSALAKTLLDVDFREPLTGTIVIKKSHETYGNYSEKLSSSGLTLITSTSGVPATDVKILDSKKSHSWTEGPAVHFEVKQIREESSQGEANLVKLEIDFYKDGNYTAEFAASDCR